MLPKLKFEVENGRKYFFNSGQIYNAAQNYKIFSAIFDFRISVSAIISANFGHMYSAVKNNTPEIENIFSKLTAEINTKITNELSARLSEVNSTFTAELGRINNDLNNKLTREIKKIHSRDAGYASEAQKILSMVNNVTTRLDNIEEACRNDFSSVNVAMEIRELGGNIKKVMV